MKKLTAMIMLMICFVMIAGCADRTTSVTTSVTEPLVASTLSTPKGKAAGDSEEAEEEPDPFVEYCQENKVTLNSTDVEFDMSNLLDRPFILEGTAELSTYYNYGFDDSLKKDYFCIAVKPYNGKYSNRWHIYCSRDTSELFEACKEYGRIPVQLVCTVPSSIYEESQGNMACMNYACWWNMTV